LSYTYFIDFSSDTEWELETVGTGQVILKGGPYEDDVFDDYVGQTCVKDDICYNITVHDSFGDG
jgi:hypothetical protein